MDVVLTSLPFTALEAALRTENPGGPQPALRNALGSELAGRLQFVPLGTAGTLAAKRPPAKGYVDEAWEQLRTLNGDLEIWGFDQVGQPHEISNVTCRVWGESYDKYLVLEALRFGHETLPSGGSSTYSRVIKAVDTSGVKIDLPLENDFVKQTWLVTDVTLPAGNPRWPLKTAVDKALVQVLVYEFVAGSSVPAPLVGTDAEKASFAEVDAACKSMSSSVIPADAPAKLFSDSTFFPDHLIGGVSAATGETAAAEATRNRIVVILSWTFCKSSDDFAPGSPIPMGRVYPNAVIVSNASYRSFEVSIQFDRPDATTNLDNPKQCCKSAASEMHREMNGVLIAEANEADLFVTAPPLPVWSNIFSYYLTDPTSRILQSTNPTINVTMQRLRMVRNDRNRTRSNNALVVREVEGMAPKSDLMKRPRQGEFDNLHSAPPMKCPQVKFAASDRELVNEWALSPIAQSPDVATSLEHVWMAPFCAHDCFHVHWRWADYFGKEAVQFKGWSGGSSASRAGALPYAVDGAPMVQAQQSVDVWYRTASKFTYHAFIGNHAGNPDYKGATVPAALVDLPPGDIQYVCHHGAAYGLNAEYWWARLATTLTSFEVEVPVKESIESIAPLQPLALGVAAMVFPSRVYFFGANRATEPVVASMSWALMYWRLRYTATWDSNARLFKLRERITHLSLPGARAL